MSPPTLEEVYATAVPLVAEAANRYRVEPGFFEDLVQEWVVGYAHGKHDVVDLEHVRAALRQHFRHRAISRLRRPYKPVALLEGDEAVDGLDEEEREQVRYWRWRATSSPSSAAASKPCSSSSTKKSSATARRQSGSGSACLG